MDTGVEQARSLLQSYAKGQPLGSEATSFPSIVEEVRQSDPAKAQIMEEGFADFERAKSGRAQRAKELLSKLKCREPRRVTRPHCAPPRCGHFNASAKRR